MNLAIFGGSFNPPHIGHLIVLESVRDQLVLDKVILVPSAQPPNKPNSMLAPPALRLEMTELAVKGNPDFEVSGIELQRRGMSFTVDTINQISALHPRAKLFLIIGADNMLEFDTWKAPDDILAKAELIVMSRPGYSLHDMKSKTARAARFVNVPQIGISGTDIRRRVKLGRSIRYLVPRSVEEYILQKRLYK